MTDTELLNAIREIGITVRWDKPRERCMAHTDEVDSDWGEDVRACIRECIDKHWEDQP